MTAAINTAELQLVADARPWRVAKGDGSFEAHRIFRRSTSSTLSCTRTTAGDAGDPRGGLASVCQQCPGEAGRA